MGIKQKFAMLAGIVGILLAIVSILGYYTAYSNLEESMEREISSTVGTQGAELEGWLMEKAKPVTSEADLMTELSDKEIPAEDMRRMLSLAASDKDVQEMTRGDEQGMFLPYYNPDETGKTDPTKRPWYTQAREAGRTVYTEVYQSKSTGDLVVSAVAPFYDNNKKFMGAICGDITLDVLKQQVQKIKYHGEGKGYIIEKTGKLLATAGKEQIMSEAGEIPGIGAHLSEMYSRDSGFFSFENSEGEQIFAYTTVPSTGWVVGMAVPYDFVFASVHRLRLMYAVLTLVGLGLALVLCQSFAQRITRPILALEDSATSLASGNLTVPDVPVESGDEIGNMTNAFNQMKQQLHRLLGQMSATSERLSAASQELAAIAQQSANASLDVAETVEDVATGMDLQLKDIDWVKQNVDAVFIDIDNMSKLAEVASAEVDSDAVDKMGEIVETISAISDQTNLLAQNVVNLVEAMDSIDTVSRKTSENTQIISAATEEQSASNEEIAAASQSLAKLASDMQDAVHKFKL